jgi:cardiolipin synthase
MPALELPFGLQLTALEILGAAAALAVTVHTLLTNRDVRGAIGWIGLAWLSPVIGALLYYVFGVNRVMRRAARLRRRSRRRPRRRRRLAQLPRHIAMIAAVGDRVADTVPAPGTAITALRGGADAYRTMLAAIADARRTVALAAYIFRADAAGDAFIDALTAAHRRGVSVRVLLDGVGSGYLGSPTARRLRDAGVPVARFLHTWLPWRMPFINMRNHKKLLVVDGAVGFTGGLNIGAENLPDAPIERRVDDLHFRVAGPVVRQLLESFAEDWTFTTGETLDGEGWWPLLEPAGAAVARGITSGPDETGNRLEAILATAVGEARHRIRIMTPYFLPDQHLQFALDLAALRGVRVELLVPSRSDHRLPDWAMRAHLAQLVEPGTAVHYTPEPFDHSKLMTVDGRWCALGSANWDVRSMRLNFEFTLECYDAEITAAIDRVIDDKLARTRPVSIAALRRQPVLIRLRNAAAHLMLPYL